MTAGRCPACGGSATAGARFCRSCGAALGLDGDRSAPAGPAGDGGPAAAVTSLRRDAPSRWWLAAAALVVAVMVGAWAVSGVGRDDTTASPRPGSTAPGDDGTSATPVPTVDGGVDGGASGNAPLEVVKGGGPVLGRPVGWSLVLGDSSSPNQGLWRYDLDTGRMVDHPGVSGGPVLAIGDRVVLVLFATGAPGQAGTSASVQVVDADSLTVGAVTVAPGQALAYPGLAVAAEPGAGDAFWLYDFASFAPRWYLVGTADGEQLQTVDAALSNSGVVAGAGPEVAGSPSGGVFRRTGDGYRLVAPGQPVAARGHDVLVRSCSSPTECSLAWVDRDSGQAVDRPVPAVGDDQDQYLGGVPGSDRYLVVQDGIYGPAPSPAVVLDLDTGRAVDISPGNQALAASPDGRYLVIGDDMGSRSPVILDVETGERHEVPRLSMTNVAAVFVPNT